MPTIGGTDFPNTPIPHHSLTVSVCLYRWWIIYSPQVTSHLPTHHPIYLSPPVEITPRSKNNTRLAKVNILDKGKLLSLTSWQEMLFWKETEVLSFYLLLNELMQLLSNILKSVDECFDFSLPWSNFMYVSSRHHFLNPYWCMSSITYLISLQNINSPKQHSGGKNSTWRRQLTKYFPMEFFVPLS